MCIALDGPNLHKGGAETDITYAAFTLLFNLPLGLNYGKYLAVQVQEWKNNVLFNFVIKNCNINTKVKLQLT